jgi:hypothetical protein
MPQYHGSLLRFVGRYINVWAVRCLWDVEYLLHGGNDFCMMIVNSLTQLQIKLEFEL